MRVGTLPDHLPDDDRTLGWQVLAWASEYIRQPDGPDAGKPFRFTSEQVRFILWWYAVDDRGRWVFRRGVLRRLKGWGKSPFVAALSLVELCGPCRFGGWDADGNPVGVEHPMPWIQLAAVSEDQARKNTLAAALAMIAESPIVDDYGLDPGKTQILYPAKQGQLHIVTASSSSLEGGRPSFAVGDETQHWVESQGGHKLEKVLRRNLGKSRDGAARLLTTTNAHAPGQDSVAERDYEAFLAIQKGQTRTAGLLYDSVEAPPIADLGDEAALREAIKIAAGDATWIDIDTVVEEIYDPTTPAEESRRFYLNQITAAADSWVLPHAVDACEREDESLEPGEMVALGFDGAKSDDSSVLVASRIADGHAFELGAWEKPLGPMGKGWEVDRDAVDGAVQRAFEEYDVVAFFSDVREWESYVDVWANRYREKLFIKPSARHAVAYDMRGNQKEIVAAAESLAAKIDGQDFRFSGKVLSQHYKNARRRESRWGITFGKESRESPRKVDGVAATVLAEIARTRALEAGVLTKRRKRTGKLYGF